MVIEALLVAAMMRAEIVTKAAELPSVQQEQFRECVARRESNHNPRARNPRSSAAGTYQFLDSKWRRGLAHMTVQRLKQHGYPTSGLRDQLRKKPINQWPERYQHVAFAAVLNAEGPWSGWRHWHLPGSPCNRLVAR